MERVGVAAVRQRGEGVMTCAEFQKVLPYIIDTGGNEQEQEHLRTCHLCSDLVADLRYIAEQAKLLVNMDAPPARVWRNIHDGIEREGLTHPRPVKRGV